MSIFFLALERDDAFLELLARMSILRLPTVMHVVEIEDLADFGEREANAPASPGLGRRDARAIAR